MVPEEISGFHIQDSQVSVSEYLFVSKSFLPELFTFTKIILFRNNYFLEMFLYLARRHTAHIREKVDLFLTIFLNLSKNKTYDLELKAVREPAINSGCAIRKCLKNSNAWCMNQL